MWPTQSLAAKWCGAWRWPCIGTNCAYQPARYLPDALHIHSRRLLIRFFAPFPLTGSPCTWSPSCIRSCWTNRTAFRAHIVGWTMAVDYTDCFYSCKWHGCRRVTSFGWFGCARFVHSYQLNHIRQIVRFGFGFRLLMHGVRTTFFLCPVLRWHIFA